MEHEILTVLEKDGEKIEVYSSMRPERLEGETKIQYDLRRKFNEMRKKSSPEVVHISSFLIPEMTKDGKIKFGVDGKPNYIGKSKGVTYRKNEGREAPHQTEEKEIEHKELLDEVNHIAKAVNKEDTLLRTIKAKNG